nr:copia protein [Tanacetum cinerariifolium]
MDVKSVFLNDFINEEVYVAQPSGFTDFQKPNYIYKLKKALYGLKQASKACYDRLKAFLIKHEYSMGTVDNTLFTKKSKSHLMIVQIYIDDIIFGSTSQNLCDDFAKIMHDEFEMSMIGEFNFFLGLQIKQIEDITFFNQSKYIKEMLKKFGLEDSKPTKTPMSTEIKFTKDDQADSVNSSKYQGTKMPSEYQQDYKKTRSYAPKIYNDPNMSDELRDIYWTLESRYVHEGRTIDLSFYNDLSDDPVAKFTAIGICIYFDAWGLDELEKTLKQIKPYNSRLSNLDDIQNLIHRRTIHEKANMAQDTFDERYKLVPRKMSSLKAKQPKKPPPKRTRNVGKALKDDPNMSKEQRETIGMFKNLGVLGCGLCSAEKLLVAFCLGHSAAFYARSRPNGKMIVDSIENGPYVRRMIATPEEPDLSVPIPESFHKQTDKELTENDIKRMYANDQAIQTILLGLLKDEKKAKLFNEWEKFTSTDGESIESYYHRFMQLMNDLKRNKHFPENIAANLKFLNNLQPEWKRHVTIVRQTNNLYEADFTQIYDFLKMNQDENFMQLPMTSLEDSNDPTEAMNAALILFAKAFILTAPTNNNQRTSSNPRNRQIAQPVMNMSRDRQIQNVRGNGGNNFGQYAGQVVQNQQGYNAWQNGRIQGAQNAVQNAGVQSGGNQNGLVVVPGIANQNGTGNVVAARAEGTGIGNQARCYNYRGLGHIARNCTARTRRRDVAYLQTQLLIAQKEEAGIQLQAEEFDFMDAAGDLDEIKEVNADCILMAKLQHASTSGTQLDKAPVYDTNGSAENDNHVTFVAPSMVQSGGTVETSFAPNEETRAYQETVYRNLVDQVAQEKYDKLEKCYQKSVYQEQCLTKKINALHLSSAKQITTLNDEISNLNKQLSKEKSSISSLMEEKKKLKYDFKTREDKFLDKEVDLEAKIKDLENILLKRDQTVQIMHMLNPKTNLFYHPNQKIALGYLNPLYLKKAQLKQQSLYNGNLLLEEHNPSDMYDSEETLELAQETKFVRDFKSLAKEADESLDKQKSLELEIERLLKASFSHDIMSIVQTGFVDVPSDLQTELDRTKEKLKLFILKKEKEYDVLWNNWYTKCEECKYDKISYDKAYNDMQQKVERLQAQLRDLKGKSSDTPSMSNTLDLLNQKLESKIVELEFQVVNYEREISHLKTTYKNLFDSITSNRAHAKLHNLIYENAQLRARAFENTSESMNNTSGTSVTPHVDKPKLSSVTPHSKKLHASIPSHSVPQPKEFNVMKHRNVIAPGMFKINPS